mmetsp:Transcript_18455/g.52126  ORF Transcript_18455/g.52126 Transcript_18455/m.52126 type:complete len:552 (-) Transcript_18455:83-1738(-)
MMERCCQRRNLCKAIRHNLQLLMVAIGASAFGLVAISLPSSRIILWASSTLLERSDADADLPIGQTLITISPSFWTDAQRAQVSDTLPFAVFIGMRANFIACVSAPGYGIVAYLALEKHEVVLRRVVLVITLVLYILFFAIFMGSGAAYLTGLVPKGLNIRMVIFLVAGTTWVPGVALLFAILFPRPKRCAVILRFALMTIATNVVYLTWVELCRGYFSATDGLLRLVLGGLVPPALFCILFELYYWLACHLCNYRNHRAGVVLLLIPLCLGATGQAVLQLGSTTVLSGVGIEAVAALMEMISKYYLLHGDTPLGPVRRYLPRCWRWLAFRSRKQANVMPHCDDVCPVDPKRHAAAGGAEALRYPGAVTVGSGEQAWTDTASEGKDQNEGTAAEGQGSPQKSSTGDSGAGHAGSLILKRVVLYSNLIELVVQTMVAGMFMLAKVNPNEEAAPPLPHSQVLTLMCIKYAFELLSDFVVIAMGLGMDGHLDPGIEGVWMTLEPSVLVSACFLAIIWALEAHVLTFQFLCPSAVDVNGTVEVLSIGLCPGALST